ncbi:MAG TPA: ADOP family duplicated permease [Thermoanaerobaculia bacterium]
MRPLLAELHLAARSLARRPAFSLLVVGTLGLGMAAAVGVFSLADAVLLRPLPFPAAERLVAVWEAPPEEPGGTNVASPANFLDWQAASRSFTTMAAFVERPATLSGAGEPEEVRLVYASPELFGASGLTPAAGTWPRAEDQAVALSHDFWLRRFGGDPGVVGSALSLGGESATVAGVAPAGLSLLVPSADVWMPIDWGFANRTTMGRFVRVVGRLAPGASLAAARQEMDGIAAALAREHADFDGGWGVTLVPLVDELLGDTRPILRVLLLAAALLLTIACANAANLLLTRGLAREREVAIRASLGAGRVRLARSFLAESLLLSAAAAAVAVLAAAWMPAAVAALPEAARLPRAEDAGADLRVLAAAIVLALVTSVAAGAAPALAASRRQAREALGEGARTIGGRRGGRLRGGLVVAEVALSLALLAGAGLMLRSLGALTAVEPGFDAAGVVTARVPFSGAAYQDAARRSELVHGIVERLAALPGVEAAGAIQFLPLSGVWSATSYWPAEAPPPPNEETPGAGIRVVTPGYLEAMRVPLLAGRPLTGADRADAPRVALVNRTLARETWPGEDPIGRRITLSWTDDPTVEVVGVVGDVRHEGLREPVAAEIYLPFAQSPEGLASFVVRSAAPPEAMLPALREAVREADPTLPVADLGTVGEVVADTVAAPRLQALLLALFAGAALLLSAVGLYGVLSQAVVARTGEIGVRLALGARRADVLRLIVASGMLLVSLGLVVGVALSLAGGRALDALVFEVGAVDPLSLAAAAALLAAVSLVACLGPAMRAARLDPLLALREE